MSGAAGDKRIVLPGDRLCVIEEYLPRGGARELRDGRVVALVAGYPNYEHRRHEVSVTPLRSLDKLSKGDLVLCEVRDVQEKVIGCDVIAKQGAPLKQRWSGVVIYQDSRQSPTIGDLLIARVEDEVAGMYNLTISERGLGCVVAFCDKCGSLLRLTGSGSLACPRCRATFRRRTVSYYGSINKIVEMFGFKINVR